MPVTPQPRFTDLETFGYYLSSVTTSVPREAVQNLILCEAEYTVERYCRRRFVPEPALRTDYTRQVVYVTGQGQTNVLQLAGSLTLTVSGQTTAPLTLPITAAQMQAALNALSTVPAPGVTCDGGPIPSYPINVYMKAWPTPATPPLLQVNSAGLNPGNATPPPGFGVVVDAGYDSNPPLVKKFTTRGRTTVRMPDLRAVDAGQDPNFPGSGGVILYGRRLFPNQYFTEYGSYGPGGSDEPFGVGDYSTPASEIILGYGYGLGMTLAQQFAFVLPQMYLANDLWITGRWGWNPTPADVVGATYAVATRRYRERDAGYSDQLMTPEGITLGFFKQLPASVKATLDSYRVPNFALI